MTGLKNQPERSLQHFAKKTHNDTLATRAQKRLATSPYFALRSVSCRAKDDRVILHGQVETFFLKQLAQEAVRNIDGVRRIENNVEVE